MNEVEIWRPVASNPLYSVSSEGRVRNAQGRTLTPVRNSRGYLRVRIGGKLVRIHRLVALAFHGEPPFEGAQARHLDDDKSNNTAFNVAWGTGSDNQRDSVRNGSHADANKTHCPRGHAYEGDNLRIRTTASGRTFRSCRQCTNDQARARWAKNGDHLNQKRRERRNARQEGARA